MEFFFNKNTEYYYKSAKKFLLSVNLIDSFNGFSIELGKHSYFFMGFYSPLNNNSSATLADNKYFTNQVLADAEVPVPKAVIIHKDDLHKGLLEAMIKELRFPLVVKPTTGSLGKEVICNIDSLLELKTQVAKRVNNHEWVTIEEFHGNLQSYRILLLNKKIIAITQRYPARVIGDGRHNIKELVVLANLDRQKPDSELGPIVIDDECYIRLNQLGITPEYIPELQEEITLCYTCNTSRGGTYKSIKVKICKSNKQLFVKTARTLNLNLVGIDVECSSINTPILNTNGVIIEANASPSIRIHEAPQFGHATAVTKKIIRALILRHPFSYIHMLFKNLVYNKKSLSTYVRSVIAVSLMMIISQLAGYQAL